MELEIFENEKVPNSRSLKEPPCTGQYLALTESVYEKTQFQIIYYRDDTKSFYLNIDCPKDRTLDGFWRINVKDWILLKKLEISDFE